MKCCCLRTAACCNLITDLRNFSCALSSTQRIHGLLASIDLLNSVIFLLPCRVRASESKCIKETRSPFARSQLMDENGG